MFVYRFFSVYLSFLFACGNRLCKKKLLSYSQFFASYDKNNIM
jgi:hypothetical protein